MPVDKRILKTKMHLKQTIIRLLNEEPFEKLTVSQLCKEADTSRITFYTYYEDKQALIEEMIADYYVEADTLYHVLQERNNPEKDALKGYFNLLDCIMGMIENNMDFFSHMAPDRNPYLTGWFYRHIFENFEKYIRKHDTVIRARYTSRQTAALLCAGLTGVLEEITNDPKPWEEQLNCIRSMYADLLNSNLFIRVDDAGL